LFHLKSNNQGNPGGEIVSQPRVKLVHERLREVHDIIIANDVYEVWLSSAKTKKTAYKRAAAKLRKLADEAERLAEES